MIEKSPVSISAKEKTSVTASTITGQLYLTCPSPQSTSKAPLHWRHWYDSSPIGSSTGTVSSSPQCGQLISVEPVTAPDWILSLALVQF